MNARIQKNTQNQSAKINKLLLKSLPLGAPPTGWEVVRLADVTSFISTGATPRGGKNVYKSEGVSLIRSQNVYDHEFSKHGLAHIDESAAYKLRRVDIQEDDVLLNITGDSVARCCVVPKWTLPARVNQHVAIIRTSDRLNSTFLQKYLSAPRVKAYVLGHDSGGTRKALTKAHIESFLVALPPLPEQQRIGHILGSLDDKIELNRQMNETLEAMARAIFKSWFVDFDPVRAKMEGREPVGMDAETAALFPSKFQGSPLGEIPAGWEVTQVKKQAARIQYGFTQSASNEPVGPKFLRITDIANGMLDWGSVPFCYISEKHYDKYKLQDGDILVARTGATTGANIYIVDPPDAVFASYLVRIQFANLSLARLVSEFMCSSIYNDYVAGCIGGSAQPNASAQLLTAVEFAFPPMEVVERFYETVHPLDKRHAANNRQSQTLAEIRDVLLPQLLSGEIRVNRTETGQHD